MMTDTSRSLLVFINELLKPNDEQEDILLHFDLQATVLAMVSTGIKSSCTFD